MSASNGQKNKKRPVIPMAVMEKVIDAGKWTYSKPHENKKLGGFSLYPRDGTYTSGPCPQWRFPAMITPFMPQLNKGKTPEQADAFTNYNLELSVRDDEVGQSVKRFMDKVDDSVFDLISANCERVYGSRKHPEILREKHRRSLIPKRDKETKAVIGYPYLMRVKVHETNTKWYKVTGTDAKGRQICVPGSMNDVDEFCTCLVSVRFAGVYSTAISFGGTYFAKSVVIFPKEEINRDEDDDDDDGFDFGEDFVMGGGEDDGGIGGGIGGGAAAAAATPAAQEAFEGIPSEDQPSSGKRVRIEAEGAPEPEDEAFNSDDEFVDDSKY